MKFKKNSEFELINEIVKKLPKNNRQIIKGIGDDAAVIKKNNDKCFLYTCDSQVNGVHFSEKYSSPHQIGRKTVAVNFSDIAAMGGIPKYILVSLFLPVKTNKKFIDELYDGIYEECGKYKTHIIGGNISKSNQLSVDIFCIGEISSKDILFRSGAKVKDLVFVTGSLGKSAAGLKLLKNTKIKIPEKDRSILISKHLMPTPRINEGNKIAQSRKANAMIDISDGLSSDLGHICEESKVGVKIFSEKLPISGSLKKFAKLTGESYVDLVLNGGEDYELCFTAPNKYKSYLMKAIRKLTVIGEIIPQAEGKCLIDQNGKTIKLESKGWDHLL